MKIKEKAKKPNGKDSINYGGKYKNIMGYKIEFNWVLKFERVIPKNLKIGKIYNFKKSEERIYPLHMPIGMCGPNGYDLIGKVEILEFKVSKNKTEGKFRVIEIF